MSEWDDDYDIPFSDMSEEEFLYRSMNPEDPMYMGPVNNMPDEPLYTGQNGYSPDDGYLYDSSGSDDSHYDYGSHDSPDYDRQVRVPDPLLTLAVLERTGKLPWLARFLRGYLKLIGIIIIVFAVLVITGMVISHSSKPEEEEEVLTEEVQEEPSSYTAPVQRIAPVPVPAPKPYVGTEAEEVALVTEEPVTTIAKTPYQAGYDDGYDEGYDDGVVREDYNPAIYWCKFTGAELRQYTKGYNAGYRRGYREGSDDYECEPGTGEEYMGEDY